MSWICKNCETENPDILDICEVCETHAPQIEDFQYDKILSGSPIIIRWKTKLCDKTSIFYMGKTIDVSGKSTYSIDTPNEQNISFLLSNSNTTTRTISFTMEFIERPTISFSSSKSKLRNGCNEYSILSWTIENAGKVYLICNSNKIEIPLVGKQKVSPNITTNYKIEALAMDGKTFFVEELQIGVFDECIIDFKADKYYIFPSVPVVLSWKVTNGKSVILDSEPVDAEGKKVVMPRKAVSYILSVEDEFGIKERRIDIGLLPVPQVKSILVETPDITNNISVNIQQPRYHVGVRLPVIEVDWIKAEVPKVPSLTDLGINVSLSPPLPKFSLRRVIKSVYNKIKK